MLLVLTFLLGAGNFALHKAVLESGHPLLEQLPWFNLLGRGSLVAEFVVLIGAMLMVATGFPLWGWVYIAYSGMNALAAWLILTRRI